MKKINTIETLWESPGKNHEGKPFFSVKQSRGYYTYGSRVGKDSIAFILYNKTTNQVGLIYESKPPMDTETELCRMTTAFGGSIDMGENTTFKEICQTEIREESGFCVDIDRIHFTGKTLVSTQMNQMCHTYLVDVTGIEKTETAEWELAASEAQKDKDANEFAGNEVRWMNITEMMDNGDWKSIYIFTKAQFNKIIKV